MNNPTPKKDMGFKLLQWHHIKNKALEIAGKSSPENSSKVRIMALWQENPSVNGQIHEDVIKWRHFPRNWPFVREFTGPRWFRAQRPVTRSFDVFFDLRPNKRLSKQWWGWGFETLSSPLWRHCNAIYKRPVMKAFSCHDVIMYVSIPTSSINYAGKSGSSGSYTKLPQLCHLPNQISNKIV